MTKNFVNFVGLLLLFAVNIFSQGFPKNPALISRNGSKNCQFFLNGKLLNNPQPIYPTEAKIKGINGKVEVAVEIDEHGNVTSIENLVGNDLLKKSASDAAWQAKFSPTLCNGIPAKNIGVITFNFPKISLTSEYFKTTKIEDFKDVKEKTDYFEAISFLTQNYRIAFGYADRQFHAEMPLTKGDFIHFLRQTLEMLEWRGKLAQKPIKKIGLFKSYNPYKLKEFEFAKNTPYAESLKILADEYKIVLAEKDGNFVGNLNLKKSEIIEIWHEIFGEEAIPVNFSTDKKSAKEMSRGEFALYLKESLDYLSYKVLP